MMNSGWKGIMLEFGSQWLRWLVSNLPCSVPVSSWSHWNTASLFCFSGTEQRRHFPLCDTGPVHWELSLSAVRLQPLRRELRVFDMCCAAQQANKPRERERIHMLALPCQYEQGISENLDQFTSSCTNWGLLHSVFLTDLCWDQGVTLGCYLNHFLTPQCSYSFNFSTFCHATYIQ